MLTVDSGQRAGGEAEVARLVGSNQTRHATPNVPHDTKNMPDTQMHVEWTATAARTSGMVGGGANSKKLPLSQLNAHLMCVLCGGYYIDATTIIECLHSFCRSCIVKHLESSRYCPICEVQVHKTRPLTNIRPDKTLQDIVYKLVPGLFANEMRTRRRFYKERPHYVKPADSESVGEVSDTYRLGLASDSISIALRYTDGATKGGLRYLRCPAAVSVYHLAKLVRAKYGLCEHTHHVELSHEGRVLHHQLTLSQVACISRLANARATLDLTYRICENLAKRQKLEVKEEQTVSQAVEEKKEDVPMVTEEKKKVEEAEPTKPAEETAVVERTVEKVEVKKETDSQSKEKEGEAKEVKEEKEVQLQISEAGVMSVSPVKHGGEVVKTVTVGDKPRTKKYKTIRHSPKTWHPAIPKEKLRPTLIKSNEPTRPPKFFKMRNTPRFLGNPASGVKPLYAGEKPPVSKPHEEPPGSKPTPPKPPSVLEHPDFAEKPSTAKPSGEQTPEKPGAVRSPYPEHTGDKIVKIDPKTLRPIDKSPQHSNLLTNPFIPNSNHFLFSDPLLLPPTPEKPNGVRCPPNPYAGVRHSLFSSYPGYHAAGFHASLPPSISLLFNPHQHFKTHAFSTKNCDINPKKCAAGAKKQNARVTSNAKEEPSASVPVTATSALNVSSTPNTPNIPSARNAAVMGGTASTSVSTSSSTTSQSESSVQCK